MSKQLALGQRVGYCRAVYGDKRFVATVAEIVDRLGDNLLARPIFSEYKHGQVGAGDTADGRSHGLDLRAYGL